MHVTRAALKTAGDIAQDTKNKAANYYNTADPTVSPGITVLVGAPLKGNKVTGPGLTGILELKAIVNPKRGQGGFQFVYGAGSAFGGGAAILTGSEYGLTQGPLKTGWSESVSGFLQFKAVVEGVPVDVGASATKEKGGGAVSGAFRLGACCGEYIGTGVLHKQTYTYVNDPLWGPDYPEKKE